MKSKLQPKEGENVETVRAELNAEAEMVMATSVPTPTQADMDKFVTGQITVDEKEVNDSPEMPSLAVQQAMIEAAENEVQPVGGARDGQRDSQPAPRPTPAPAPRPVPATQPTPKE